ncbi:spermatogenesis-associated protein 17 [Ambystoma mexicanum]|uniref:spermatogenesis-associated protein 17 n=1 Tax=Ambystoma mexicanum TaxID=8296 RepID=UPI0037E8CA9F
MASLVRLQTRSGEMRLEYQRRNRDAEEYRIREHNAAVKIQSWFRGCRVRAYLRYLHRMMTVIQKWWRGFLARKVFRHIVKTAHFIMKMNFYNAMAVRIQRRWRGYYVRKHVHNYYALKEYLDGVDRKNKIVRKELEEFAAMKEMERQKQELEEEERRKDYQARRMHYLVSTVQVPGVFNSPYRQFPDPMEYRIQTTKPLSQRDIKRKEEDQWTLTFSSYATVIPTLKPLPPIGKKKPQGPFRDTAEVLQQRYKPLEPTLRVATSINCEAEAREQFKREEWARCIQDKDFVKVCVTHKNKVYEPSIHSSGEYRPNTLGMLNFREDQPEKWRSAKDFRTVFPPFNLFEKFGHTYSRSGETV